MGLFATLCLWPLLVSAQLADSNLHLPWNIDADSTTYDGKTATTVFNGLHLSRGSIAIQADEGRVSNKDEEDSSWLFNGNVVIEIENGRIECESATLLFDEYALKLATVTGSPASFTVTRPGSNDTTRAEAGKLSYDVGAGIIEFSDAASITEGSNQFSSNHIVYNLNERRINADSHGTEDGRVRIIYTPTNGESDTVPQDEDEAQ